MRRAGCSHTSKRDFSPRPPSCPSTSATSTSDTNPSNSHHPNTSTSRHSTTTVTSNRRRRLSCQGNSFTIQRTLESLFIYGIAIHIACCRPEKLELIRSQSVIVNPCILCFDSAATVALKPCGHAGFCAECAKQVWPLAINSLLSFKSLIVKSPLSPDGLSLPLSSYLSMAPYFQKCREISTLSGVVLPDCKAPEIVNK